MIKYLALVMFKRFCILNFKRLQLKAISLWCSIAKIIITSPWWNTCWRASTNL